MTQSAGILARRNGATIAYRQSGGKNPGLLFIHGLRSDMNGTKALALERYCRDSGRAFICFDLSGHGADSARFDQLTLSDWVEDVVAVLDQLTRGPQILVGSSLGGWLMLLAALARPERVAALLGLAAAPDFTEDLLLSAFKPEMRQQLDRDGKVTIPDCYGGADYAITRALIEDGRRHLLLRGPIPLPQPVTLLQGQKDADVPWQTALRLAERLQSDRVQVTLIKSGDHRLSDPGSLALMIRAVDQLLSILALD